jgi:hypothetical protein
LTRKKETFCYEMCVNGGKVEKKTLVNVNKTKGMALAIKVTKQ